jgi:hypothetical protein
MESEEIATAIHEMSEFCTMTAKTLANHKTQLTRHEEILAAQYRGGTAHRDAIEAMRTDMRNMAELVDSQSRLLCSLQTCLLKVLQQLGLPTPEELPDLIN